MKRPNYKEWVKLQCELRGLRYFISNSEFNCVSEPGGVKVFIGFRDSSIEDIEMRGAILYIVATERLFYTIAKFLKEHQTVMI